MSKNVNVLSVIDAYVTHWSKEVVLTSRNPQINDAARCELAISTQVRAAVAELIEAATEFRNETFGRIIFDEAQANRLRTALDRVKGA